MKGKSIIDAVLVFSVLQAVLILPVGVRDLIRWENRVLGGSYLTGVLLVVLAVIVIVVRRYEFRLMGLEALDWRRSINTGFRGWMFFIVPQLVLSFFQTWGIRYQDYLGAALVLGMLVLVAGYFMSKKEAVPASNRRLMVIVLLLLAPLALGLLYDSFTLNLLKTYSWNILVGGFAEELFYRGYIQSSINQEYGREWRIGKTSFGPGLIISAFLYGLGRGMRTMKPWSGVYAVSWSWTLYAFTLGVFYGLIRENAGDILASGTANGLIDTIGEALVRVLS